MIARIPQVEPSRIDIPGNGAGDQEQARRSVLAVLWRRRWTLAITVVVCLAAAGIYLLRATPIFTSHSSVYIEQQGVKIMSDAQGFMAKSDSYLYTQAQIFKSAPILNAALGAVNYRSMKTFAQPEVVDNPVAWLQKEKDFHVEVGKKDDVVTVSLDSPYKQEAADVVNAVVDAYVNWQNRQKRTTATEMLKILQKEKKDRDAELSQHLQDMLEFKKANGALSFQDNDKGNIILERLATLSNALTTAELATLDLRTQKAQMAEILKSPDMIERFIDSQQTKDQNGKDQDLDSLRSKLEEMAVTLSGAKTALGDNHPKMQMIQQDFETLQAIIRMRERRIAEARMAEVTQLTAAAEGKQRDLQATFEEQQKKALELNTKAAEYQRLQADVDRTQKQCDLLDSRIKEVNVNSEDAGALNIQVLEVARPEDKPSKPRKALTMAAALLVGLMLGTGLALTRDWLDQSLRTPDDVLAALGTSILGIVPHIRGRHSQVTRGQILTSDTGSDVAEAYRTIRTAVYFGAPETAKTILFTSPAPGDGKSTTASNMAIALAQAGHRTLLLDADLRKPVQHKVFDLADKPGITSVLSGAVKLREAVYRSPVARLYVLPVGELPQNPSEIMTGKRFAQVMSVLTASFDKIVIDSPPTMSVADARILAASADVSVLVVRTNKSKRKMSALAVQSLQSVGANLLGCIVNDMPRNREGYGYYYGGYYNGGYGNRRARSLPAGAADEAMGGDEATELPPDVLTLQR